MNEQPPTPQEEGIDAIIEKVAPSPDMDTELFLERAMHALEVAEQRKPVEEALATLFPGQSVHVTGLRRVEDGTFEVLFNLDGEEIGQFVKIQDEAK